MNEDQTGLSPTDSSSANDDFYAVQTGSLDEWTPNELLADMVEDVFEQQCLTAWQALLFPFRLFGSTKRKHEGHVQELDAYDRVLYEFPTDRSRLERMIVGITRQIEKLFALAIQFPFFAGSHFLLSWLITRESRRLLYALPAVLLMAGVLTFVAVASISSPRLLAARYRESAFAAMDNGDFATATLCHQKLEQLEPSISKGAFKEAERLAQEGRVDEAYQRMLQLAPVDGGGYPSAHLWIAQAIASNLVTPASDTPQQSIKVRVDHVLRHDPQNEMALRLLAQYHLKRGATETAVAALKRVGVTGQQAQLERDLQIAAIYHRSGELSKARRLWEQSAHGFAELFKMGESLWPTSFAIWSTAQFNLHNREAAIRILQLGIEQHPESDLLVSTYRTASAELLDVYGSADQAMADKHFETLKRMVDFEPAQEEVMMQVAKACAFKSMHKKAEKLLEPGLREGSLPAAVYARLADAASKRGDIPASRRLYSLALEKDPKLLFALNNLAWILAHHEPANYQRALTLIDQAVSIDGSNVNWRGTRGEILLKLKRWDEARLELDLALNGDPRHSQVYHEALAIAYDGLGNRELSAFHRNHSRVVGQESSRF